jgi:hypothetical protein
MEITIGTKVKHIPSGDIITVEKINPKSYLGSSTIHPYSKVRPQKSDCEIYIEPKKEKSFYEIMRERNMEDAKKLPQSPKEISQHILWLKMAVIDRVEKIENLKDDKICTFKQGEKFGFTEPYVNLLMHYAYEAGKKQATDNLTRHFEVTTRDMKNAIDSIINALDTNDLLPYEDNNY